MACDTYWVAVPGFAARGMPRLKAAGWEPSTLGHPKGLVAACLAVRLGVVLLFVAREDFAAFSTFKGFRPTFSPLAAYFSVFYCLPTPRGKVYVWQFL